MKIVPLFLITVLLAVPVRATELPSPGNEGAMLDFVAPAAVRPSQKVAGLTRESHLSQALELPASDLFVADEPDAASAAAELELKLPEESLPESDLPLTFNDKVAYFISHFQTTGRGAFARWLSRSERYIPMMKEVLKKEGLPEDLVYLAMIESGFSPHA